LEVELPPGVQAPAVLVQDAPQPSQTQPADQENRAPSEGQKAAQQQIANQFANDLAKAAADGTATGTADGTSVDAAAWAAAQQRADEHYRLLFGDDAYNQKTIQAAREALNGP
jgi:hypothetical protein